MPRQEQRSLAAADSGPVGQEPAGDRVLQRYLERAALNRRRAETSPLVVRRRLRVPAPAELRDYEPPPRSRRWLYRTLESGAEFP